MAETSKLTAYVVTDVDKASTSKLTAFAVVDELGMAVVKANAYLITGTGIDPTVPVYKKAQMFQIF